MASDMTAHDRTTTDLSPDSADHDRSDFVPVAEAARRLGVSTATVKRRIRDGSLEAEPLSRPQGIEYRVRLNRDVPAVLSDLSVPLLERNDSETVALNPSAHGTTQDMSAAITAAVAPLVERLTVADRQIAERDETIRSQSETIADLREARGRLTAENAALLAAQLPVASQPAPESGEPSIPPPAPIVPTQNVSPWWWSRWLVVLVIALVLAVLAPIGLLVIWQ
jgi:hypothetical protein